ncbi:MAG: hypothetical protein AB4372_26035 [Xenococcus sp. (in: cyanobacteria)]
MNISTATLGYPLKSEPWSNYLSLVVDSSRLSAAITFPETQIHTHICYSEFGDITRDVEAAKKI